MTIFDLDNKQKTKHLQVLESLMEQGHALQATHNPETWRLSALTLALHMHDCYSLFSDLKEHWANHLPFEEAWDVDFQEWTNNIWSMVNNVSSFTEQSEYSHWKQLCEEDYQTFIDKAQDCLDGKLPLSELTNFLKDKNSGLRQVVIDSGEEFSQLLIDIDRTLNDSPSQLYESFFDEIMQAYQNEHPIPMIEDNYMLKPYAQWKASIVRKKLPDKILSKLNSIVKQMSESVFWQEVWEDCFNQDNKEIDREGFGRFIFTNRKIIIGDNSNPCRERLEKCFGALSLCELLWHEHEMLTNPTTNFDLLKEKILPDIQPLNSLVKEEKADVYQRIWNSIFQNETIMQRMAEESPTTFKGGYNKKLVCNIIGMMCDKDIFSKSKNKIDEYIYTDTTVYKYLNETAVRKDNSSCAMSESIKQAIEKIIENPS